jgi:hypothetical protein
VLGCILYYNYKRFPEDKDLKALFEYVQGTQEDVLVNAVLQIAQGRVIDEGFPATHIKFGSQCLETLAECAFLN